MGILKFPTLFVHVNLRMKLIIVLFLEILRNRMKPFCAVYEPNSDDQSDRLHKINNVTKHIIKIFKIISTQIKTFP